MSSCYAHLSRLCPLRVSHQQPSVCRWALASGPHIEWHGTSKCFDVHSTSCEKMTFIPVPPSLIGCSLLLRLPVADFSPSACRSAHCIPHSIVKSPSHTLSSHVCWTWSLPWRPSLYSFMQKPLVPCASREQLPCPLPLPSSGSNQPFHQHLSPLTVIQHFGT